MVHLVRPNSWMLLPVYVSTMHECRFTGCKTRARPRKGPSNDFQGSGVIKFKDSDCGKISVNDQNQQLSHHVGVCTCIYSVLGLFKYT